MTARRKMVVIMNMIGFSGAIYRTECATICQPMTRIDTPIAVCFLLLLFAMEIATEQRKLSVTINIDNNEHHQF